MGTPRNLKLPLGVPWVVNLEILVDWEVTKHQPEYPTLAQVHKMMDQVVELNSRWGSITVPVEPVVAPTNPTLVQVHHRCYLLFLPPTLFLVIVYLGALDTACHFAWYVHAMNG